MREREKGVRERAREASDGEGAKIGPELEARM
jgi:hypothetical protein